MALIENEVKSVKKADWRKIPDAPLGKVVEENLESRKDHAGKGKTARKKEREIIKSLEIVARQETEEIWIAEVVGFRNLNAKGRTENEAIGKAKTLAKVAAQNSSGLDVQILVDGKLIQPILEKK